MILITKDGARIVTALETIADQMKIQDSLTQAHDRIDQLESLLRNGARLMANPQSTDEEWQSWLERIQETVT